MSIWTFAFLANIIVLLGIGIGDEVFLKGQLFKLDNWVGNMLGLWVLLTYISIPTWVIYLLWGAVN